jgi:hypothetical protein
MRIAAVRAIMAGRRGKSWPAPSEVMDLHPSQLAPCRETSPITSAQRAEARGAPLPSR